MIFLQNLTLKKKLKDLDQLWSVKSPLILKEKIETLLISEKNAYVIKYLNAINEDVLNDSPVVSLEILTTDSFFTDLNLDFLNFRLAYLCSRAGKKEMALSFLKSHKNDKSKIFKMCLNEINGEFTMTQAMLDLTQTYGVHTHFGIIEKLVRKNKFSIGVELGVLYGYHLSHLLESCRNLKMSGVDLYQKVIGSGYDNVENNEFENLYLQIKSKLESFERFNLIREDTISGSNHIKDKTLDFVFIDADHRYEAVKNDINAWQEKIKNGGILAGHDYDQPDWPGVRIAVNEWATKNSKEIFIEQGNVWWCKI
jgi:predicted O-methyltransferase YrrM